MKLLIIIIIITVDSIAIGHLFFIHRILENKWKYCGQCISYL